MTSRLLYFFDPLCGWCYGFGPALRAVRVALPDLAVDLRFGGLVTGTRVGPYADRRTYIEAAQIRLKAVTGLAPGPAFHARILQDRSVIASSIPPCDALVHLRDITPEAVPDFAEALQAAHFNDGADYNDPDLYVITAARLGYDFHPDLPRPDQLRPRLAAEFGAAHRLGVSSYPTLLLQSANRALPVDLDYSAEAQVAAVKTALAKILP